jgi:hypothetical protein
VELVVRARPAGGRARLLVKLLDAGELNPGPETRRRRNNLQLRLSC